MTENLQKIFQKPLSNFIKFSSFCSFSIPTKPRFPSNFRRTFIHNPCVRSESGAIGIRKCDANRNCYGKLQVRGTFINGLWFGGTYAQWISAAHNQFSSNECKQHQTDDAGEWRSSVESAAATESPSSKSNATAARRQWNHVEWQHQSRQHIHTKAVQGENKAGACCTRNRDPNVVQQHGEWNEHKKWKHTDPKAVQLFSLSVLDRSSWPLYTTREYSQRRETIPLLCVPEAVQPGWSREKALSAYASGNGVRH